MLERGTVFRFVPTPDQVDADRTLSIPLSLNWHHPLLGLPAAQVVRFAESVFACTSRSFVRSRHRDHGRGEWNFPCT